MNIEQLEVELRNRIDKLAKQHVEFKSNYNDDSDYDAMKDGVYQGEIAGYTSILRLISPWRAILYIYSDFEFYCLWECLDGKGIPIYQITNDSTIPPAGIHGHYGKDHLLALHGIDDLDYTYIDIE
jgi:hypothetical protein